MFEPVNANMSLRDRVVQDILQKIRTGDLTTGQKLPPERDMAVQFNVSRTTVRDALRTLAALGVLSIEHGRGIFVRGGEAVAVGQALWSPIMLEHQTVSNLFEVRKSLETAAAGWAAERASTSERREMVRIVTSVRDVLDTEDSLDIIAVADEEFHRMVFTAGHNPVAARIMVNLLDMLEVARRQSLAITGRAVKSVVEHNRIAQAIAEGDKGAAEAAMLNHLAGVEEEILSSLNQDSSF